MARGRSLHIGLNRIDPAHYGEDGPLDGCENDARAMRAIARARGFRAEMLLTERATSEMVTAAIEKIARVLRPGDLFLLTYAGHGSQVPDQNGDESENGNTDARDETWCLYDRMLVDDELYALWGRFETGVRILVLSDSCHSGSVVRATAFERWDETASPRQVIVPGKPRQLSRRAADRTYRQNRKSYNAIQKDHPHGERVAIGASVILISGCQDNQLSGDGPENGAFTTAALRVWDAASFTGGHRLFRDEIAGLLPSSQSPNYLTVGAKNETFERQTPFTI